jgi:hypothetical protein
MIYITIEPMQIIVNQISTLSIVFTNWEDKSCTHIGFRLRLPSQIVLLEGNDKIDIARIDPHEHVTHIVHVRPKQIGSWMIGSSSFSYRDSQGLSQHPSPLQQEIRVIPTVATELSEPKVFVKLSTTILPLNEWDQLEGEVVNSGNVALYNIALRILGPIAQDLQVSRYNVGTLNSGESRIFQILVRAEESGNKVPLQLRVSYDDDIGRGRLHNQLIPVQVMKQHEFTNRQSSSEISYEDGVDVKKINVSTPKIFISYSHVDEKYMARLVSMLRPLEKQGIFEIWHDREITAGNEWYQEIRNAINTCDLALLLISVDFLNSRFIQEDELPRLLQLRKEKGLRVIPIILRHCTWTSVPILKDLQALPKDGRPVISFRGSGQPDRIWAEIAKVIEELSKTLSLKNKSRQL